jgi:hypothetical protein
MPDAKPIILTRSEVRELLAHDEAEVRRTVRPGPVALQRTWKPGDRLWVREGFAARRDDEGKETIHVRYSVDQGGASSLRIIPILAGLWKFATRGYRTWPATYLPRQFCRLLIEVVEVREEGGMQIAKCKLKNAMRTES